ncbi:Spc98 family protein [Phyllosticta citriasiana]|uniref:Spindle pole body component n=1 Tax=Phyllosticta citriasiana TaxID=595635 RepID=A0ABR1KIT3_9PEZI
MLHEILLSLSGHPSPLFESAANQKTEIPTNPAVNTSAFPLLSPPEAELLKSVAHLAELHRATRKHASRIASSHESTICRAVATAIVSTHLARFQQKILDVEDRILKQDASIVGAYNIVPLAGIVAEFDEWTRRMEWFWDLANFMLPAGPSDKSKGKDSTRFLSASLIDKLRQEAQTGYSDIEAVALDLSKVAETAWLRQLSTWVLYGKLPTHGSEDFFISLMRDDNGAVGYVTDSRMLPKFVSSRTASSILFIGRSLDQIRSRGPTVVASNGPALSEHELLAIHLQHLSELQVPLSSAALSEAISEIRLSLSRNMLQQLLPLPKILQILSLMQEFFLLGRGEFSVALIENADEQIQSRQRNPKQSKPGRGVHGMLIKEAEVSTVLAKTWAALTALIDDEEMTDENLDLARNLVSLSMSKPTATRPPTPGRAREAADALPKLSSVAFNDLLLSVPTTLTLDISPPLDLFLTQSEVDIYSSINAYLLAIRRAHLRLTALWRESNLRREHPTPYGPPTSNKPFGQNMLRMRRERSNARTVKMRKVWATCGAAVFLLSEFGAYFEGEIVQESWKHFRQWIVGGDTEQSSRLGDSEGLAARQLNTSIRNEANTFGNQTRNRPNSAHHSQPAEQKPSVPHDPEVLAKAHRLFLSCLSHSILLTDIPYTHALRSLLTHVDALIAFLYRLRVIQANLDLEADAGVIDDALANHAADERDVLIELDRSRKRVDADLRGLVARLRELDRERVGWGTFGNVGSVEAVDGSSAAFEPWRGGGVDRLLMKLDFGTGVEGQDEDDEDALLPV